MEQPLGWIVRLRIGKSIGVPLTGDALPMLEQARTIMNAAYVFSGLTSDGCPIMRTMWKMEM